MVKKVSKKLLNDIYNLIERWNTKRLKEIVLRTRLGIMRLLRSFSYALCASAFKFVVIKEQALFSD